MIRYVRRRAARKRSALLRKLIADMPKPVRIVDLGGTAEMWRRWGFSSDDDVRITLVNNHEYDTSHRDRGFDDKSDASFSAWNADVRTLTSADYEPFDLIFSNSMLEHLYSREAQRAVAQAIVGSRKSFFVQVPNRNSLVDPHFPHVFAPFFAAWPRFVQARALCLSGLGGGRRELSVEAARHRLDNYVPLSRRDLASLFPGVELVIEWSAGIPMSLVVARSAAFGKRLAAPS